jgi:hypothetical protein
MRKRRRHGTLGTYGDRMKAGDVDTLRRWAISDLGGTVYDFLWTVDNTWPHQGPSGIGRLSEEDFEFASDMLEGDLDTWSWLALQPGDIGVEGERFASLTRALLDHVIARSREGSVEVARELWGLLRAAGYEPKIALPGAP